MAKAWSGLVSESGLETRGEGTGVNEEGLENSQENAAVHAC